MLSNEDYKVVRTNVMEASSLSWFSEIICCCCRYTNKPTIPPATNISTLINFFAKYPSSMPIKNPPPIDTAVGIRFSIIIVLIDFSLTEDIHYISFGYRHIKVYLLDIYKIWKLD